MAIYDYSRISRKTGITSSNPLPLFHSSIVATARSLSLIHIYKTVKQGSGQKTDGAVNASEESTKGAAESATEGVQVKESTAQEAATESELDSDASHRAD